MLPQQFLLTAHHPWARRTSLPSTSGHVEGPRCSAASWPHCAIWSNSSAVARVSGDTAGFASAQQWRSWALARGALNRRAPVHTQAPRCQRRHTRHLSGRFRVPRAPRARGPGQSRPREQQGPHAGSSIRPLTKARPVSEWLRSLLPAAWALDAIRNRDAFGACLGPGTPGCVAVTSWAKARIVGLPAWAWAPPQRCLAVLPTEIFREIAFEQLLSIDMARAAAWTVE